MAAMASVGAKDVKQSTEPPSLNQIQRWDVIVRPLVGPIGRPVFIVSFRRVLHREAALVCYSLTLLSLSSK